jgi:hypothetical protein
MLKAETFKKVGFVLGVIAVTYFVQKNVMKVPVVGAYLPGGEAA